MPVLNHVLLRTLAFHVGDSLGRLKHISAALGLESVSEFDDFNLVNRNIIRSRLTIQPSQFRNRVLFRCMDSCVLFVMVLTCRTITT